VNIGTPVFVYRLKPLAESHLVKAINAIQPEVGWVTFVNFDGSINVGGFAADGSVFSAVALKPAGSLTPPTLPYYSLSLPPAPKPVVTGSGPTAPVAGAPVAKPIAQSSGSKPVVTR
jgi:hypothetical protein